MKWIVAVSLAAALCVSPLSSITPAHAQDSATQAVDLSSYGKLPLSFEANRGQTDASIQFLSRGSGYALFLRPSEAVLALGNSKLPDARALPGTSPVAGTALTAPRRDSSPRSFTELSLRVAGANPHATVVPEELQTTRTNYFLGNDPGKWRTDIPNYGRIHYSNVYPGIDLVYYGNQRRLEHDFLVAPKADPARIILAVDGMGTLAIEHSTGDLLIQTSQGEVRLLKPVSYQISEGRRTEIPSAYKLLAHRRVSFSLGAYNHAQSLVIDPVLVYSTYLGGGGTLSVGGYGGSDPGLGDQGNHIAVDPTGSAYIVGTTYSTNFPVTSGAFQATNNAANSGITVFVSKLNAAGTALVYSTYLGGTGGDMGYGIALDASGNAYITGATYSSDFPITCGALQTANPSKTAGATAAFVARLNSTGDALVYSTYLGGSGNLSKSALGDVAQSIAVDNSGNAFLTGYTWSSNFPTTAAAFQPGFSGSASASNAFVAKLNPTGTALVYSTYLGGSGGDAGNSIAVDGAGDAYVTGGTNSANFPVTGGAFQTTYQGNSAAFVTKLNPSGSAEVYSTYLSGSGGDSAAAIALDNAGYAYVAGNTNSADFPVTAGVLEGTSYGVNAAYLTGFVAKLDPDGDGLAYSTHVEGRPITVSGLTVDGSGSAYLAGTAATAMAGSFIGFQSTPDALPVPPSFGYSAFLVKLNPSATAMNYATLFGGSRNDGALAVALDPQGNAYVTGYAGSYDFPTSGSAVQGGNGNGWYGTNAFVSKFAIAAEANQTTYPPVSAQFNSYLVLNAQYIYTFYECGLAPFDAFYADFTIFTNQVGPGLNGFVDVSTGFGDDGTAFVQGGAPQEIILTSGAGPGGGYSIEYGDNYWSPSTISGGATVAPCAPPPSSPDLRPAVAKSLASGSRISRLDMHLASAPRNSRLALAKFTPLPLTPDALARIRVASSPATPAVCLAPTTLLPLTVRLGIAARIYGKANPGFAYAITGLQKGDVATVTPSTFATSASPAGSYPISAFVSGADAGKYAVEIEPGTLSILKAPLYISAKNVSAVYGQTSPPLSAYTVSGFVNGDTVSAVSGAPMLSSTVTSATPAGFYPIQVQTGTLIAGNYYFNTFSDGEGSVEVSKAPLTIRPANFTIHAGDPLPNFTYSITGFANGDTQASATAGAPTFTTTAPSTAKPGRYYIVATAGPLHAQNYYFLPPGATTNGFLTILK